MTNSANLPNPSPEPRRRPSLPLLIVAALFVIVPFMFWYGTWFGRQLKDSEMEQYLSDVQHPRKIQHALTQAAERIERGDQQIKRLYPKIIALADDPTPQIRMTAAWVMGQDNSSQPFHDRLLRLLSDSQPLVRQNTALALVRFADPASRPELVAMLRPYTVCAEREGTVSILLHDGDSIAIGELVARIAYGNDQVFEVRSPLPGYFNRVMAKDGAEVAVGTGLVEISPDPKQVWEALRALYIVGGMEDLPDIELYTRTVPGISKQIQRQAELTAEAIRNRK